MLSVLIATHDSERALLPTLSALVSGAAAGVVREVIVADAGSADATAAIADAAGCRLLSSPLPRGARLKAAAQAARASWLMFLPPGAVLDATWVDESRRFIEQAELQGCAGSYGATFRPGSAAFRPTLIEALSLLWVSLGAGPSADQGLLIAKSLYDAVGGHRDVGEPERDLARRLGRRRLVLLRTGAVTIRDEKIVDFVK
jgi:glycosyltransferase involved in cell wall biosynthesis